MHLNVRFLIDIDVLKTVEAKDVIPSRYDRYVSFNETMAIDKYHVSILTFQLGR